VMDVDYIRKVGEVRPVFLGRKGKVSCRKWALNGR
jgi:hypothetical protein